MTRNYKNIFMISSTACVKGVLKDVGHTDITYGPWIHHIQGIMTE